MTHAAGVAAGVKDPARAYGSPGGVPPYVRTACTNMGCPVAGVVRLVYLPRIALGVVALPQALLCERCGMSMPLNLWSTNMPKQTVHGGPSNMAADLEAGVPIGTPAPAEVTPAEAAEPETAAEAPAGAPAVKPAKKTTARKRTAPAEDADA